MKYDYCMFCLTQLMLIYACWVDSCCADSPGVDSHYIDSPYVNSHYSKCLYADSHYMIPILSLCRFSALLMLIPIIPMAIKWIPIVPLNGFPWHWGQSTILHEKYQNREFFLIRVFLYSDWNLRIQSEYRKIRTSRKTPY